MPSLLEEIKEIAKLPPKLRLKKIKELKERLKWMTEKEEQERRIEEEEMVRKTVEEIAQEEEEEEKHLKEGVEVKKEETLEQIAEEAPKIMEPVQQQYQTGSTYQANQPRPISELNAVISRTHEAYHMQGRITQPQIQEFEQARVEIYQKREQGYIPPDERAKMNWQNANDNLNEMRDPVERTRKYNERR